VGQAVRSVHGWLVGAVTGAALILLGCLAFSWLDLDTSRLADPAQARAVAWHSGNVLWFLALLGLLAAGAAWRMRRKRIGALAGVVIGVLALGALMLAHLEIYQGIKAQMAGAVVNPAAGFNVTMLGVLAMLLSFAWALGVSGNPGRMEPLLKVSTYWENVPLAERIFQVRRDVLVGDRSTVDFTVPLPSRHGIHRLFRIDSRGEYGLLLPPGIEGRAFTNGKESPIATWKAPQRHEVDDLEWTPLVPGDRGVLRFGTVLLRFAFDPVEDAGLGTRHSRIFDSILATSLLTSAFVVIAVFVLSQLLWDPMPQGRPEVEKRFLKVAVDVSVEKESKLLIVGEEEEIVPTPGKFGDPDHGDSDNLMRGPERKVGSSDPDVRGKNQTAANSALSRVISRHDDLLTQVLGEGTGGPNGLAIIGGVPSDTGTFLAGDPFGTGGSGFGGTGGMKGTGAPGGMGWYGGQGGAGTVAGLGKGEAGSGLKVGFKPSEAKPKVFGGSASVDGDLDKETVRRFIQTKMGEIRFCFQQEVQKSPDLQGQIGYSWLILPGGNVTGVKVTSSTLKNAAVESCIRGRIASWRFPAPRSGGTVKVNYPFIFRVTK